MIVDSTLFWNPVNRLFSIHQVAFEAEFDGGPRFDFLQRISIPFKEASSIFPHLNKIQKKAALFYIYIEIHWILEREIFIFTLDNCSENYNIPWKIYCRSEVFFFSCFKTFVWCFLNMDSSLGWWAFWKWKRESVERG